MEYIILFAVFFIIFVIYMIRCIIEDGRKKRLFERTLRTEYGKRKEKNYPDGRLASIQKTCLADEDREGFIDDITARDLEIDRLFVRIDRTFSSAGEESLYRMLRAPLLSAAKIDDRRSVISWIDSHEEERIGLQLLYAGIGKTGKHSVQDYLGPLLEMEDRSNAGHFAVLLLMAASMILAFFNTGIGLICFLVLFIYNLLTYFREKKTIDPYITTFGYVLRLLAAAGSISEKLEGAGDGRGGELLSGMGKRIGDDKKVFAGFERFSFLVTAENAMSSSPMDLVMEYLRMGFHLNLIKFNSMLGIMKEHSKELTEMTETAGYIEACISVAEFVKSLQTSCEPVLSEEQKGPGLKTEGLFHPLVRDCVPNDVDISECMLLTGSNASGKSTFIRTVAVSQLLSQTIGYACAKSFESGIFRIYTSMALRDDPEGGRSYFIVETESLKRIVDAASDGGCNVMCFIDEVLRGTNTAERIAASSCILESLSDMGVFCFAATHDLELCSLLLGVYADYHFEETVMDDDISFDYLLRKGGANGRNAIKLLSMMGYPDEVVKRSEERCALFLSEGRWE
ncbi:MAG: hypothetical protein J5842_02715 [Lachnospiraceae bacterium]|nr:hypothetical protein [Lachnospiraceae bacterium]